MTSGWRSKGVDLDSIFDPYIAGTTKARAAGWSAAGLDLSNRYANIIYGSAAAATGWLSEGADLNTLYAKKGTAAYALGFNGIFSAQNAGRNNVTLTFNSLTTWAVTTNGSFTSTPGQTSGSLTAFGPVNEFLLHVTNAGESPATLTTAARDVWTPISSGLLVAEYDTLTLTGQQTSASFTLAFRENSGNTVSNNATTFTIYNTLPP